jgi:sialic acid synthase SpsE
MILMGDLHTRSLYFIKDLNVGDVISSTVVKAIRPGYGIPL